MARSCPPLTHESIVTLLYVALRTIIWHVEEFNTELPYAGWRAVNRDTRIAYDLESNPLQIKTDSAAGSGERVRVNLIAADGDFAGFVQFIFSSPPQYYIGWCRFWTDFPSTLPSEMKKVWQLTKLPGPRITVQCNGATVLDILLSHTTCTDDSEWSTYWTRQVVQIRFGSIDTASAEFRAAAPGNRVS